MIYLDISFITIRDQELLFKRLKELMGEVSVRLDKVLIDIDYKWNENISVIDWYTNIYNFLLHNIQLSINKINYYFIINVKEYTKEKVYDYVIIKGACVYFLTKLFNLLEPFCINNKPMLELLEKNNKILEEFKSKIYITFNGTLDKFIKSNIQNKETNLQIQKIHTDSKSLFWLFDSCCNKLDSLDVYTFLAN